MKLNLFHKAFNIFASLALIAQSFVPALALVPTAYAEETPAVPSDISPTQGVEETTLTPEITAAPINEVTSVPSEALSQVVEQTPTPEPSNDSQTPNQSTDENSTQTTTNANAPTLAPPSPTVTPIEPEDGVITATILEDVSAPSVDLSSPTSETSATISTDKADYAPTDTALITGTGFTPNKTYSLTVSSSDDPATSTTVDVTADENGSFIYAYQLDGNYRPNYKVVVKDGDETIATTTFTDTPTPKVEICHATNSNSNPYNSANADKTADAGGHDGHNGPVWFSGITESWGDIIPPFNYSGGSYPGKNWPAGEAIWNNNCTVIQQAHLTLLKTVTNDNGGSAVDTDWTLTASGPTPLSGVEGNAAVTNAAVNAGTYTLSESGGPSGYTAGTYSCVKNSGAPVVNNSITLAGGDTATCTINNNDNAAHLIVIKHVVNDNGGSASASDFTMTIHDVIATGGNSFAGAESPGTNKTLTTVGSYSVTESGPSGYTDTYSTDCTGTIALSETKTCTVTNDDQQAYITVVKEVTNDNGGTANPDDFDLTLEGNAVSSGVAVPVNPGTYTAGETNLTGYEFEGFTGDCDSNGDVTVALGESKTCTLTNNDIAPKLTLKKVVENDNGGTAVASDWTLTADGPTGFNGAGPTVNSDANFYTGTYDLSESGPSGYSASDWVCTGVTQDDGDTVTLNLGDDATCTITNNDIQPKLTLIKHVTNDNGGTLGVSDFPLFVDATGVTSGDTNGFDAGTYTASETNQTGYAASAWSGDCAADGSISLNVGDEKTCEITNDDIAPHLIVIKHVINDDLGVSNASDFTMNIGGVTADGGNSFPGAEAGVNKTLTSVGAYNVTESGPGGYDATFSSDCTGTIALGQTKTCTIINNDQQGRMTGGGSVFTKSGDGDKILDVLSNNVRVTHGFEIHCRIPGKKDNIEINWNDKAGKAHKFHLDALTSAVCRRTGNPSPPKNTANGFNRFEGVGTGSYDGVAGAALNFVFTDFGEPGKNDTASYNVSVGSSNKLSVSSKNLDQGNHQAHRF